MFRGSLRKKTLRINMANIMESFSLAVVCSGKLPKQPISQLSALLLCHPDDVRDDSPLSPLGGHDPGRPWHPDDSVCLS